MERQETRSMSDKRKELEGKVITRGRKRKLEEEGITDVLSSEIKPGDPVFKKRAKAAQTQERREISAKIDAQRIAAGSSSKQDEPSTGGVMSQPVIEQPQVKREDIVQSPTSGSQPAPPIQDVPSIWPPKPPKLQVPGLNLNLGGSSVPDTEMSNVDVPSIWPPKPAKPRVSPLKLNLGEPSVTDAGTSDITGSSQEKQQVSKLAVPEPVSPEIELLKNLEPEDLKAFCKKEVQKYTEKQKEFQYISDISTDLEAYAKKEGFAIPPELKQFRDDFKNFSKSVQQLQSALESDGVDSEALLKMYGEIIENQRKLDSSREKYRTGALEEQMDMNWVDEPGKLAVGGFIREHKALRFAGVSVVVDLREKCDDEAALQHHNIELLHRPMTEYKKAESLEVLKNIAEEVNDRLGEGKYVLVHCREGKGRSPQVASCVLAMQGIKDARFQVYDKRPGCALSQDQSLQAVAFENQYRPKSQEEI